MNQEYFSIKQTAETSLDLLCKRKVADTSGSFMLSPVAFTDSSCYPKQDGHLLLEVKSYKVPLGKLDDYSNSVLEDKVEEFFKEFVKDKFYYYSSQITFSTLMDCDCDSFGCNCGKSGSVQINAIVRMGEIK